MALWTLEPGHTAAEFRVRHMMVTWVRGLIKDVHGRIEWDPEDPTSGKVQAVLDVRKLWTGQPQRDQHLKSADFFDAERFPWITFQSEEFEVRGASAFEIPGMLTIRGVTRPAVLAVEYLGTWQTSFWEDGVDKGPITRAGFTATTEINRHDFGVSWNDAISRGGVVVGERARLSLDIEAIREPAPGQADRAMPPIR